MLLTAAVGSKVTLTFPFGPKPKKFTLPDGVWTGWIETE